MVRVVEAVPGDAPRLAPPDTLLQKLRRATLIHAAHRLRAARARRDKPERVAHPATGETFTIKAVTRTGFSAANEN